ncbi:MAG: hypothetical protein C0467_22725 [Planctomycetaceae bacterium]|nr:hypothetical protein [Planctomycetaceae bacterium]
MWEAWINWGKRFTPDDDEAAFSLAFVVPTVFNLVTAGWVHPRPIRGWHSSNHPAQSHLVSVFDNPLDRVSQR